MISFKSPMLKNLISKPDITIDLIYLVGNKPPTIKL